MKRRLLTTTARWALVAVTIATAVAWPLSGWWRVSWCTRGYHSIGVGYGCLWVGDWVHGRRVAIEFVNDGAIHTTGAGVWPTLHWSFKHYRDDMAETVRIPLWPVVPALLTTTTAAWRTPLRATLRRRRNACPACGYARTGLPAAAPRPECGTVPT